MLTPAEVKRDAMRICTKALEGKCWHVACRFSHDFSKPAGAVDEIAYRNGMNKNCEVTVKDLNRAITWREEGAQVYMAEVVTAYDDDYSDIPSLMEPDSGAKSNEGFRDGRMYTDAQRSCLLYTSPSPRDRTRSRMPSSA